MKCALLTTVLLAGQSLATTIIYRIRFNSSGGVQNYETHGTVPDGYALGVTRNMGVWSSSSFHASYDEYSRVVVTCDNVAPTYNSAVTIAQRMRNIVQRNVSGASSVYGEHGVHKEELYNDEVYADGEGLDFGEEEV